ncbi:MAG: TonB-dependent receptor [Bacteroidota bacterium]
MRFFNRLVFLTILLPGGLRAESDYDSTRTYLLGEVVVTGRREAVSRSATITEIQKTSIAGMDVFTASGALSQSGGIYVRNNSRNEMLVTMRGYDQRQVGVFLDGVPAYLPFDGILDLGQIGVAPLGKITATKGMPSVLYGANSMGGTINLVTDEISSGTSTRVRLQGGLFQGGLLSHGGAVEGVSWYGAFQYGRSSGFPLPSSTPVARNEDGGTRNNSHREGYSLFAKVVLRPWQRSRTALSFFHVQDTRGIPTSIHTSRPRYWRYTDWRKSVMHLLHESFIGRTVLLKGSFFYETYYNVLDSYDDSTFSSQARPYAFSSTYDDYSYGGSLTGTFRLSFLPPAKVALLFKRDVHREEPDRGEGFNRFEASVLTIGLEQELPVAERFLGVVGLSHDRLQPDAGEDSAARSPEGEWGGFVGVGWNATERVRLHANSAWKSRFPTLKELYSERLGRHVANPSLAPERGWNLELGITWSPAAAIRTSLALFQNDVKQIVENVPLGDGTFQYQNIGRALFRGFELEAQMRGAEGLVSFNYTYLHAENRTAGASSPHLEHRPRHIFHSLFSVTGWRVLHMALELSYTGLQQSRDLDSGDWQDLSDYWLLNLRASYRISSGVELFARLNNATDSAYETEYGFPQPGRHFIVGAEANF